jgi:hypothetical protein
VTGSLYKVASTDIRCSPAQSDQNNLLDETESIRTLTHACQDDRSSSLLWLRNSESRASVDNNKSDTLSRLNVVFDFDDIVVGSKPYRVAVVVTWKSIKGPRHDLVTTLAFGFTTPTTRVIGTLRSNVVVF